MRALPAFAFVSLVAGVAPATGCGGSRNPAQSVSMLKSANPDERRAAAHDLRAEGGPSADATRAVLEAIKTETDEHTYGEMLITLGASGAPEAEAFICPKVYAADARARNVAKRALKLYLEHNRASPGCPPPGAPPSPVAQTRVPGNAVPTAPAAGTNAPAPASGVTIGPTK